MHDSSKEQSPRVMTGHCLCGSVRFEAEPDQTEVVACHCDMCRHWTGFALMAVSVDPGRIRFEGTEHIRIRASSPWAERAWCDECGSPLYYRVTVEGFGPRTYEMSLGLFDEPERFSLSREIYIDSKPASYAFAGERPRVPNAVARARFDKMAEGAG